MGYQIRASRDSTNVPFSFSLSPSAPAATAVMALRDEFRTQTPPFYLDFGDLVFKQAAFTTRQIALTPLGDNFFALDGGLNLAAVVAVGLGNLPISTFSLAAEYLGAFGDRRFNDIDHVELAQADTQVHVGFARIDASNIEIDVFGKRRGLDVAMVTATLTFYNSFGAPRFTVSGPPPGVVDPQGHITFAVPTTLVAQAAYCVVTITDAIGSYTTHRTVPFSI